MLDNVTRLSSRESFFNQLDEQISALADTSGKLACLIINIYELKKINATLGYDFGDALLKKFSERIRGMLRHQDSAARIGDNKFALLLSSIMNSGHATLAANKVLSLLEKPFDIDNKQVMINATIGIALFPEHADDAQALLRNTETALDQAKSSYSEYKIYCQDDDTIVQQGRLMTMELKDAIEGDELLMYYQPQISIQRQHIVSAEALVRWQHPQFGMIAPDRFIGLAENCGLIVPLTIWTLNTTLRLCKPCLDQWPDYRVSLNMSAALLHEEDLADIIQQSMQIWGIDANRLMLEVTESAIMIDPDKSLQTLHKLSNIGIALSIDDFGTGHASLAYLKRLPVDEIKIDKSFVMNMNENEDDRKIVRSVIDLGHNFDLSVVAEGIESEQTLHELKHMGCDVGQGYYISRPLPIDNMLSWVQTSPWKGKQT